MEAKFIEPTISTRIKLSLVVLFGIALDIAIDLWWHPFMEFVSSLPLCEQLPWLRGILVAFVVLFWAVGILVARAAVLTLQAGQSPLPEAWVWARTKVRTGWRAKVDGYVLALLALFAILGPVLVIHLAEIHLIFCWPASCGC